MTEQSPSSMRMPADVAGASMVFGMRLLLSISALLTLYIAPADLGVMKHLSGWIFGAYTIHSAALLVAALRRDQPFWHGKIVYWVDLAWFALMLYCSGGDNSFFSLFFFFVILSTSFQWGFGEGARITLASALLLALAMLAADRHADIGHLLLRVAFVLALGFMIAYWGGLGVTQRRRRALLRDVNRLSNPRFGVDHTITSVLQQTARFYRASNCILLMRDQHNDGWLLRSTGVPEPGRPLTLSRMSAAAAAPLLVFGAGQTVLYGAAPAARLPWTRTARALEAGQQRWREFDAGACERLADLFDGCAFISIPLPLKKGEGRIYIVSKKQGYSRSDATFLRHLAAQVFPVIENIELLDRLASEAAFRERQKIARDLHDSTIQPYIGLRHALSAMRLGVAPDNPLLDELDKILAMCTEVIGDMRNFAKSVRGAQTAGEPELLVALRRQAAQVREFYDVAITIKAHEGLALSDRLAAEVFQIANEGMSNIRKHTRARAGLIELSCSDGWLCIRIENDNPDRQAADFLPGSIAERAAALGGTMRVRAGAHGATAIHVAIPV